MRRWMLMAAGLMMSALATTSSRAETAELTVELTGMTSDAGSLIYALWSNQEHWLIDEPDREGAVNIENGTSTIHMAGLPYGEYAISVYHDKNDNGKLDTGFFRIPKEPIGTSNDARIQFGPPKYTDARFIVNRPNLTMTIQVRKLF
jgi:uncharacterized protein (DUF2141 family)